MFARMKMAVLVVGGLVIVLVAFACGGGGSSGAGARTATATPSATSTTTETPTQTATPTPVPLAFVVNSSEPSIVGFDVLEGSVSPSSHIAGPDTGLRMPLGIAIASRQLYVANTNPGGAGNLLIFLPDQSGDARPAGTISIGLVAPVAVATDAAENIYVLDKVSGIVEFPAGAGGGAHPIRAISYAGLSNPMGIAVGPASNIWIAEGIDPIAATSTAIYEFASNANGPADPVTTISGDQTTLGSVSSIAFDAEGNLWAADGGNFKGILPKVVQFSAESIAPGGQLNIAPISAIAGLHTMLLKPTAIHFDESGDIWVSDLELRNTLAALLRFDARASGDNPPKSFLQSDNSGLGLPQQFDFFR